MDLKTLHLVPGKKFCDRMLLPNNRVTKDAAIGIPSQNFLLVAGPLNPIFPVLLGKLIRNGLDWTRSCFFTSAKNSSNADFLADWSDIFVIQHLRQLGVRIFVKMLSQANNHAIVHFVSFPLPSALLSDIWRQRFGRITCQNLRCPCFRLAKMRADSRKIPSVISFQ